MVEAFLKEVQASIYERFSERDTEFIMRCIGDVATKYSIEKSCTDTDQVGTVTARML